MLSLFLTLSRIPAIFVGFEPVNVVMICIWWKNWPKVLNKFKSNYDDTGIDILFCYGCIITKFCYWRIDAINDAEATFVSFSEKVLKILRKTHATECLLENLCTCVLKPYQKKSAAISCSKLTIENTWKKCEICSKLTIKHDASDVVLVSLLLTLNIYHTLF